MFTEEFIRDCLIEQECGEERRKKIWKEFLEHKKCVEDTISSIGKFYNLIESGKFEEAINIGALQCLIDEKYAKIESSYITVDKLLQPNGERVWRFSWIDPIIQDVGSEKIKLVDKENYVELIFKIEKDKRRINTEFFLYNPSGNFDDREKLHIVWEVTNDEKEEVKLVYLGVGTNEPYDYEHVETGKQEDIRRARYFIFDDDEKHIYCHNFDWKYVGNIDWDNLSRPIENLSGGNKAVYILSIADHNFCLSDSHIVSALQGIGEKSVFENLCKIMGIEFSFECASEISLSKFREMYKVYRVEVSKGYIVDLQEMKINLCNILSDARKNYLPYYTAFGCQNIWERDIKQLMSNIKQLKNSKLDQYKKMFSISCSNVICEKYKQLVNNLTLGELLICQIDKGWPKSFQDEVDKWRNHMGHEMAEDLYFYGLYANERLLNLLFAVELAMNEKYGNTYKKLMDEAKKYFWGHEVYGKYEVELPK